MQLQQVVPWGRTAAEYRRMFALSDNDLHKTILGCGDGPASFNAELTAQGHQVISIDPIYQFSASEIEQQVWATYPVVVAQVKQQADRYCWRDFVDADDLGQARLGAMRVFLADYEQGKATHRYQAQSLPSLTFGDQQFSLALCSHFLFLYSDHLTLEFHRAAIQELVRVATQVRIFPVLTLAGERSPYCEFMMAELDQQGLIATIVPVAYEFQKGGNEMMVIRR